MRDRLGNLGRGDARVQRQRHVIGQGARVLPCHQRGKCDKAGDITLYAPWGDLSIFYKPFQRSRGLVRLGAFDGPIDVLVRDGDFPVRIELAD
ncbi:hypothetical protein XM53_20770 [Roseovarius atlanticus]|uniref:Cyclophilin-like domain-containing protein n=1 Tax=Roseovarius atlanticus TaxID=1641875 RepID=A0A0T5NND9_9RHOB|nr:hypothetical protein XM53_20770 [Roseovarius atlanticus]